MQIKLTGTKRITLQVGKQRCSVRLSAGPWVNTVNPDQIKIRPVRGKFPEGFAAALKVEDPSCLLTSWYAPEQVKLLPGHELYEKAKALTS